MVKKTYIQPNMMVANVATQNLIAESLQMSTSSGNMLDEEEILVKDDRDGFFSDEW